MSRGLRLFDALAVRFDPAALSTLSADGALNAVLSNGAMVAPNRELVAAYVNDDIRKGPDGRFRFRFSPSAAVVAWNEVTLPAPPITQVPPS